MVIVMISQTVPYLPSHDGFRLMPANFLKVLSQRHQIHLYAFCGGDETEAQTNWARQYCVSFKTLGRFDAASRWKRVANMWAGRPLDSATLAELTALRPDVVHLEGPDMSLLASSLPSGLHRILSAHDSLTLRYKQFQRFAPSWRQVPAFFKNRIAGNWIESHWYGRFDRVLVTSAMDRDALRRSVPEERISVLPNGVDLTEWNYQPQPVRHRIVFAGNMSWFPNEDAAEFFAREVFPGILKATPGAEFWIVGASPSAKVRALGGLPGVTVTGTVADIRGFIGAADVYISPLRFGAGVKNKILEAMAIGPPIIASTASLTGTPLVDGQHLLVADTAEAMRERVLLLFENPRLGQSLSRNARAMVEQEYSWDSICRRLEQLYEFQAPRDSPVQVPPTCAI
jgi:glycosyltransferase involved in cell wall biosynthesis